MISDKHFNRFVNENKVCKRILRRIAFNIIEGNTLTTRALAIYKEKTEEIENIIQNEQNR
jgi:hypothetical protein